jgi:hypothetical protein
VIALCGHCVEAILMPGAPPLRVSFQRDGQEVVEYDLNPHYVFSLFQDPSQTIVRVDSGPYYFPVRAITTIGGSSVCELPQHIDQERKIQKTRISFG